MAEHVETVIIGGGHSGLAMSYWLGRAGCEHLILERGQVAERWLSERWDSLCVLTPNWAVALPSFDYSGPNPDGFMGKDEVATFIQTYADCIRAPVRTGAQVRRLAQRDDGQYVVEASDGTILARNVVVATGAYGAPVTPTCGHDLPGDVVHVHSQSYRNPGQLPPGATLVVGAGASGFQIVEDLLEAGHRVYFSLGRHEARVRRYRGKDSAWWMMQTGVYDRKIEDHPDAPFAPRASLTGAHGGHDLNVRKLAHDGVTLLGRVQAADGWDLAIGPDLAITVQEGDRRARRSLDDVDEFISRNGIDAPPPEPESGWPDPPELADPILNLDLRAVGVTSVVWATGFRYAFDWIHLPIFDARGDPRHLRGVTAYPGLYFLGLKWQYKFKSSFIHGAEEDAAYLAEQIAAR